MSRAAMNLGWRMAHSRSLDTAPFLNQVSFFLGARPVESARADEMNDAVQFIHLKPGAVLAADIDDDPGTTREVHAMHQIVALRAANIPDRADRVRARDGYMTD